MVRAAIKAVIIAGVVLTIRPFLNGFAAPPVPARAPRVLPPLPGRADPERHVFIPCQDDAEKIAKLFEGDHMVVFIRGAVACGKSTLAAYLGRQYPRQYVNVPFIGVGSEGAWKDETIQAVEEATGESVQDGDLKFENALKLAMKKGLTLIYDEAHTLFRSDFLCTALFKADPSARPKVLLFSASGEARRYGWDNVATPSEITQKFLWSPPMPSAHDLATQLEEAAVSLDEASIDFFLKFCAGHRGIFMAAMHWVQAAQKASPEKWELRKTAAEVRRSYGNGDWLKTGILGALADSRAVRVNGEFRDGELVSVPVEFAQLLAGGPQVLDSGMRRKLAIAGLCLPEGEAGSEEEFQKVNWKLDDVKYRVANPLMAAFYRNRLEVTRGFRSRVKRLEAESCIDLLMRAVPYITFAKVQSMDPEAPWVARAEIPFEDDYNRAIVETLGIHGYTAYAVRAGGSGGKPDCRVDLGDKKFVMEGLLVSNTEDHRVRFDNNERYKGDHMALYIIGNDIDAVKSKVMDQRTEGVEIIGLIPNRAHTAYKVLVRTKNAQPTDHPFEIGVECDLVARSFTIKGDGTPDVQCVQELASFTQGNPPPGSAAVEQSATVWVQQLQEAGEALELTGDAFNVKGEMADVHDLKKSIKGENPNTVKCDAFKINIYSRSNDGRWVKEAKMSAPVRQTEEENPYGFVVPPP